MKHINTIFHQLLKFIPRSQFEAVVNRYDGDRRVRSLCCWKQFTVLLYAQFSGCRSLRDVVAAWDSHASSHYHLGSGSVKRSTLSDANGLRPSQMYLELFYWLLGQTHTGRNSSKEMVRLIDSTTIDLCKQQFDWAHFRSGKAGVKMHTVYDPDAHTPTFFSITAAKCHDRKAARKMPLLPGATYVFDRAYNDYAWFHELGQQNIRFVTRMKSNAEFEVLESNEVTETGVIDDALIRLSSTRARQLCPQTMRRIRFVRENDGKELTFITNDMERTAGEIAALYKRRWQIELFFKWIKQNLKIKRFFGTGENAVKTQIIIAMIAYLLLQMASKVIPNKRTLQQLARLVCVNILHRRSILELLVDPRPPKGPATLCDQRQFDLINA